MHDKDSIRSIERYIAQIQPHTTKISSVPPYIAHDGVPSDCSSIGSRPVRCKAECIFEMATFTNKQLSKYHHQEWTTLAALHPGPDIRPQGM